MTSELAQIGSTGFFTVADVTCGALVSGIIDSLAPPIEGQGPVMLYVEGMLQFVAMAFLGLQTSALLHQGRPDPTRGAAFAVGLWMGAGNTKAKIGMAIASAKAALKASAAPPPGEALSSPAAPQ
jgi:hypothetical protein